MKLSNLLLIAYHVKHYIIAYNVGTTYHIYTFNNKYDIPQNLTEKVVSMFRAVDYDTLKIWI